MVWYTLSYFPFPTPPSVLSPLSPFDEGTSTTQCFVNKFLPDFSCSQQMVGHLTALFLLETLHVPRTLLIENVYQNGSVFRYAFYRCIVADLMYSGNFFKGVKLLILQYISNLFHIACKRVKN